MIFNKYFQHESSIILPAPQIVSTKNEIIEVEAEEIIESPFFESNLFDWEITEKNIIIPGIGETADWKAVVKGDTGTILNICRSSYTPTSNARFSESLEKLSEFTGFSVDQVATLQQGRKVVAWLKAPEHLKAAGCNFKMFLMLGNSHDSSSAFFIGQTSTMVRCTNQFTQRNQQLRAYHTRTNEEQIFNIEESFRNFNEMGYNLKRMVERYDQVKVTPADRRELIRHILNVKETNTEDISSRKQNQILALDSAINRETLELGNTALGLFNGVTYWTTHNRPSKEKVFGNAFNSDYDFNLKAMEFCNELVK